MLSLIKILVLCFAIYGLSFIVAGGDFQKTLIAFGSLVALITHLEWKIEASRTVVNLHGPVTINRPEE